MEPKAGQEKLSWVESVSQLVTLSAAFLCKVPALPQAPSMPQGH